MDDVEELRGDVFKGFRKHNVIEYKGPGDSLDIRTVHKVIGYANFIIGTTVYKDEVLADDISITVFRAARCDDLIRSLESTDALVRTDTPRRVFAYKEGLEPTVPDRDHERTPRQ